MRVSIPIKKAHYPGTNLYWIPGRDPNPLGIRTWTYKIDEESHFAQKHPRFTTIANLHHEDAYQLFIKKASSNKKISGFARLISKTSFLFSFSLLGLGLSPNYFEGWDITKNAFRDIGFAGGFVSLYNHGLKALDYCLDKIRGNKQNFYTSMRHIFPLHFGLFWMMVAAESIPLFYPDFRGIAGGNGKTFDPTDLFHYLITTSFLYTLDRIGFPEWFIGNSNLPNLKIK